MKLLDWTLDDLAEFARTATTDVLRPEMLPDPRLRHLFDAANVVITQSDVHPCADKAFHVLCAIVLRLRHAEWRHASGDVYVPLPKLWHAIVEYGVALAREHAARLSRDGFRPSNN